MLTVKSSLGSGCSAGREGTKDTARVPTVRTARRRPRHPQCLSSTRTSDTTCTHGEHTLPALQTRCSVQTTADTVWDYFAGRNSHRDIMPRAPTCESWDPNLTDSSQSMLFTV